MTWSSTEHGDSLATTRPAVFHRQQLTDELAAATGTKPSLRYHRDERDDLALLFPRATLTRVQREAAEAAIAAHDGAASLAADVAAADTKTTERQARADELAALRTAAKAGALTAEQVEAAVRLSLI